MTIVAYGYARSPGLGAGAAFTVGVATLAGATTVATAAPGAVATLQAGDEAILAGAANTVRAGAANKAVLGGRLTARKRCD